MLSGQNETRISKFKQKNLIQKDDTIDFGFLYGCVLHKKILHQIILLAFKNFSYSYQPNLILPLV